MAQTLNLNQNGNLNFMTRKGYEAKFYYDEVPQTGYTYAMVVLDDANTAILTIAGTLETDRILFRTLSVNVPAGPYRYTVNIIKTADNTKRVALSGNFIITS